MASNSYVQPIDYNFAIKSIKAFIKQFLIMLLFVVVFWTNYNAMLSLRSSNFQLVS